MVPLSDTTPVAPTQKGEKPAPEVENDREKGRNGHATPPGASDPLNSAFLNGPTPHATWSRAHLTVASARTWRCRLSHRLIGERDGVS
jgi:hypothetical protein